MKRLFTALSCFVYWVTISAFGMNEIIDQTVFHERKTQFGDVERTVPLGELKNLSEAKMLIFDESIMSYTMGNCITIQDTNGGRKLLKRYYEEKIDNVAAMMDALVSYKINKDLFD